MSFELDRDLAEIVNLVAKKDGRTFSGYMRLLLVADLQRLGIVDEFGTVISGARF